MAQENVSIEQIINDFVLSLDSDDYANNASDVVLRNLALRGIREMGFDSMKRIKAANLTVSSTNTVDLPADYVDLVKIGTVGEDGLVYIFGENKNKNLLANNTGDQPDYLLGYSDFIYRNFVNSTTNGRLYGYGGGHYSGEYRINTEECRIELTLGTGTATVYIEYIADEALSDCPSVHVYAEQAIRSYMYYRLVDRKSNVPASEKARARQEYYNERRLANSRLKAFSKDEALKTIRKNFKQSPKY
jgi:hypothetical protein|tara:strand:- start:1054 stop:1791 length:738 start_codon:yes stop_codon:yes gene_type:complete